MSGKGGARHHTKPWVDQGLLYAALVAHQDLVKDLGRYEHISRSNAPDPKGGHALPGLVEGTCESGALWEVHNQPLRQALLSLLSEYTSLNTTKHTGGVWCNLKLERISCLLNHCRRLKRGESMSTCASKLTSCLLYTSPSPRDA